MNVASEITRIQTAKADIKASIEAKGVTIPSDALINQYADYVDEIQTGGGGGQAEEVLIDLIEMDITTLNIPNGTTKIGKDAFYYCSSLTNVTIPDSVTSIDNNAFYYCTGLTNITIPNSVTSIGGSAFNNCRSLTSINIPNGVTSIGNSTFYGCTGLTSITIPDSVTSIGSTAFSGCRGLTSVTINATTPPTLGSSAFNSTNTKLVIYVPAESVDTYKAAINWRTYASRIQPIS